MTKPEPHITTAHQFRPFGPDVPGKSKRKDLYAGRGGVVFDGPAGPQLLEGWT